MTNVLLVIDKILLPLIDLEYSARLILGKAGRGVSPEQLSSFSDAMSDVLINRYADGLLEFRSDEQMEVVIEEKVERELVPQLKRAGATGIITYALNKVIP